MSKEKKKAITSALKAERYADAEKQAQNVLDFAGGDADIRFFLAFAQAKQGKTDLAKSNYLRVLESDEENLNAINGLVELYNTEQNWAEFVKILKKRIAVSCKLKRANVAAEGFNKMIDYQVNHNVDPRERIFILDSLLENLPLFSTLPPIEPTNPTATKFPLIQKYVSRPLLIYLELISLLSPLESLEIDNLVRSERSKLEAGNLDQTRRKVDATLLPTSRLPSLYSIVLNDPDASDDEPLRRDMERRLFQHHLRFLFALDSGKDKQLKIVQKLAEGIVTIRVAEQTAWDVMLDWTDDVDRVLLGKYCDVFPESGLSAIVTTLEKRYSERADDSEIEPPSNSQLEEIITLGLIDTDSIIGRVLACEHYEKVSNWEQLALLSKQGLYLLSSLSTKIGISLSRTKRILKQFQAVSLVHYEAPNHHSEALSLLSALIDSSENPESRLLKYRATLLELAEDWDAAHQAWTQVIETSSEVGLNLQKAEASRDWCKFKNNGDNYTISAFENYAAALDEQIRLKEEEWDKLRLTDDAKWEGETIVEMQERSKAHWRLGELLYSRNEARRAYEAYHQSTTIYPHFAPAFTSVGIYYQSLDPPDDNMAFESFLQAFSLDYNQHLAAKNVAIGLADLDMWNEVEVIARQVVGKGAEEKVIKDSLKDAKELGWAWKAIGRAEFMVKRYNLAIEAYNVALRGDSTDVHTLTQLGSAYQKAGKFIPALKCFSDASKLDPTLWFAKYSIGSVQRDMGLFEPALDAFNQVLEIEPTQNGVRTVMAETFLMLGQDQIATGFIYRAESSFLHAIQEANIILQNSSESKVLWKIIGDAILALGKIPSPLMLEETLSAAIQVLDFFDGSLPGITVTSVEEIQERLEEYVEKPEALILLSVLVSQYRVLLSDIDTIGSAWYDLALSIFSLSPHITRLGLPSTEEVILLQATTCIKEALSKEPMNPMYWSALGIFTAKNNPRISQHAFIRALELGSRSPESWSNLGFFYLLHEERELAQKAFEKARILDPDYQTPWVGSGLVSTKEEQLRYFKNAFILPSRSPEADILFADIVLKNYQANPDANKEELYNVTFAMSRYLTQKPHDATGLLLLALLLEQTGDLVPSIECLERASEYISEEYETNESTEMEARFLLTQCNLGRVRLKNSDSAGAKTAFETVLSLAPPLQDYSTTSLAEFIPFEQFVLLFAECAMGFGLALFWVGDIEEAKQALCERRELLFGVKESKVEVVSAVLARICWCLEERQEAVEIMEQVADIITSSSSTFVLETLEAIVISGHKSENLSRVFNRVQPTSLRPSLHVNAYLSANPSEESHAVSILLKSMFSQPWNKANRLDLSWLFIRLNEIDHVKRILPMGNRKNEQFNAESLAKEFAVKGLVDLASGNNASLLMAEKAVLVQPWESQYWTLMDSIKSEMSE